MTTEVAVMNPIAIALAADSTVTFGRRKTYDSAEKLFELSPKHPVALLNFGNAEFMGVPWEVLFKLFSEHIGPRQLEHITDYRDEFTRFIETAEICAESKIQTELVGQYLRSYLEDLVHAADGEGANDDKNGKRLSARAERQCAASMRQELKEWLEEPDLPNLPEGYGDRLLKEYSSVVHSIIAQVLGKASVSSEVREGLPQVLRARFTKQRFSDDCSGVVIAGFGIKDHFPVVESILVDGIAAGRLKWMGHKSARIDPDCHSEILTFAQDETVNGFLYGVEDRVYERFFDSLDGVLAKYLAVVTEKAGLDEQTLKKLAEIGPASRASVIKDFNKSFGEAIYSEYGIFEAVSGLPKHELARMAESLVRMRSFRLHVDARKIDSVGGAVDVAVISKKDGFVWVRRKRYFDPALNPGHRYI